VSEPARLKPLAAAETATRRVLLLVGFGFVAWSAGTIFCGSVAQRLAARFDSPALAVVLTPLVHGGWALLVLPAIGYIAGRFLELKPWPTAAVSALTGFGFQMALDFVSSGTALWAARPAVLVFRALSVAGGISPPSPCAAPAPSPPPPSSAPRPKPGKRRANTKTS
jgi:hypothetical protein